MRLNYKLKISNIYKKQNSALNHWIFQKVSALALLPLLLWFLYNFKDFIYKDFNNKIIWFHDLSNSILLISFFLIALFHLRLGLSSVVEDYIHNIKSKKLLLSIIAISCILLSVFTIMFIYKLARVKIG